MARKEYTPSRMLIKGLKHPILDNERARLVIFAPGIRELDSNFIIATIKTSLHGINKCHFNGNILFDFRRPLFNEDMQKYNH